MSILFAGRNLNTNACEDAKFEQLKQLDDLVKIVLRCLRIGMRGLQDKVKWWERYESRGSRTVLRAAEGAVPLVDSPEKLKGEVPFGLLDLLLRVFLAV